MLSQQSMDALKQIAKGIALQFGPNCEVVIHEISDKSAYSSIVAIENGHVSGRKLGDGPSQVVLEQLGKDGRAPEDQLCYLTRTPDGKIDFYFKTRGETRVLAKILEQMDEDKYDGVHPVLISECGNQNAAQLLHHGIEAKWPGAPVKIVPCSGLCSFYAQDQGIIITY